jgi:hypothetical protein
LSSSNKLWKDSLFLSCRNLFSLLSDSGSLIYETFLSSFKNCLWFSFVFLSLSSISTLVGFFVFSCFTFNKEGQIVLLLCIVWGSTGGMLVESKLHEMTAVWPPFWVLLQLSVNYLARGVETESLQCYLTSAWVFHAIEKSSSVCWYKLFMNS